MTTMTTMDRWKIIGQVPEERMLTGVVAGHRSIPAGRVVLSSVIQEMELETRLPWVQTQNTLYFLVPGGERSPLDPEGSIQAGAIDNLDDLEQQKRLQAAFDHDIHLEIVRLYSERARRKGLTAEIEKQLLAMVARDLQAPAWTDMTAKQRDLWLRGRMPSRITAQSLKQEPESDDEPEM
ncbi:MAG: hypothetical protein AB7E55_22425 [Pigmentiphaga sp.]